jgi:hypothetical protein
VTVDPSLLQRVSSLLAEYLDDGDPDVDPLREAVAIQAGTACVLVRLVDSEPPVVRVFSPLLREVDRSNDLLAELNDINAHLSFLRLFWRDHTVFAATELLAASVDAASLTHACDLVSDLSDYYDERLLDRYGGEIAYERYP